MAKNNDLQYKTLVLTGIVVLFIIITMLASIRMQSINYQSITNINNAESVSANNNRLVNNHLPRGKHFNLNIIGKSELIESTNSSERNVIFALLNGTTRIYVQPVLGTNIKITDSNGTDGLASFNIPFNPELSTTKYEIWIRALAKPSSKTEVYPCVTTILGEGYGELCSTKKIIEIRNAYRPSFIDATEILTNVFYHQNYNGVEDQINIFNNQFEDIFWRYDNENGRLVQLRFYPITNE
jgi:hypothetical protein